MIEGRPRGHIPAIDGLRALAVLSILVFHIDPHLLPGGFAGVDVFFVISGFVVALASEGLAGGRMGAFLLAFYRRRVVRILPALVVCLCIVQLLVLLFVPVVAKRSWDGDWTGMAAALALSNVQLWHSAADYFSAGPELNPYTHTWSLGVEEQFYLLFPLIGFLTLYRGARDAGRGARGRGVAVLGLLAALSLGAAAWLTAAAPTFAFYMIPARFWQLGLGVLLYAWVASGRLDNRLPGWTTWPALAAMALGFIVCRPDKFPWPDALLPTFATALLIAVGTLAPQERVSRLLSAAPLRHFGRISYSLYLWHWPVVVLMRWTVGLETGAQKLAAFAVSWALAVLSCRLIEDPVRRSAWLKRRPDWLVVSASVLAMGGLAAAFALSVALRPHVSLSVTRDRQVWGMTEQADEPRCPLVVTPAGAANGLIFTSRGCAPADPRTLHIVGDSHAMAYQRLSGNLARHAGIRVANYGETGCAVLPDPSPGTRTGSGCEAFLTAALGQVTATAKRGDWLFLPGLRTPRLTGPATAPTPFSDSEVRAAAQRLKPLLDAGVRVAIEAPKPVYAIEPMRCADWFNRANPACAKPAQSWNAAQRWRAHAIDALVRLRAIEPRIEVWDPLPVLCDAQGCPPFLNGQPVTWDGDHLTAWAQDRLTPGFAAQLGVPLSPR